MNFTKARRADSFPDLTLPCTRVTEGNNHGCLPLDVHITAFVAHRLHLCPLHPATTTPCLTAGGATRQNLLGLVSACGELANGLDFTALRASLHRFIGHGYDNASR